MSKIDDDSLPGLSNSDSDVISCLQRLAKDRKPSSVAPHAAPSCEEDEDDSASEAELAPLDKLRAALKGAINSAGVKTEFDSRFAFVSRIVGDRGIRWRVKCEPLRILTQEFVSQTAAEDWLLSSVRRTDGLTEEDVLRRTSIIIAPILAPPTVPADGGSSDSDESLIARGARPTPRGKVWTPGSSKYLNIARTRNSQWSVRSRSAGFQRTANFRTLRDAESFFEKRLADKGGDAADFIRAGYTSPEKAPPQRGAGRGRKERRIIEAEPVAKRRATPRRLTSPIAESSSAADHDFDEERQRAALRDATVLAVVSARGTPTAAKSADAVDARRLVLESLTKLLREKIITFQEFLEGSRGILD